MGLNSGPPPDERGAERPYHTKRPHRKSRAGCRNCKTRKVKCDEARPSCRTCTLRKEDCQYADKPALRRASDGDGSLGLKTPATTPGSSRRSSSPGPLIVREPMYRPAEKDETDMRCLWFYTTKTHASFSVDMNRVPTLEVLRTTVVQFAFQAPFLMDTIMSLTAQHMKYLGTPIPEQRALAYRAKAFQGYRKAIEEAKPQDYQALLPASLFMCAIASAPFADPEGTPPFYILDWILVWRGIGLMFDLVRPETMFQAGIEPLFMRPEIDLNASALHIPSNLLFMVASIQPGEDDFPHVETYYDTLKYLGALYKELLAGFSSVLDLRIITFWTFPRREFVELARAKNPRALIIVAYYLAFAKTICAAKTIRAAESWWMFGIADRDIDNICNLLNEEEWEPYLGVPRAVAQMEDRDEMARTILNNHAWETTGTHDAEDVLGKVVDGTGKEIAFKGGFFQVSTRQRPVFNTLYGRDELKNPVDLSLPVTAGLQSLDIMSMNDGDDADLLTDLGLPYPF